MSAGDVTGNGEMKAGCQLDLCNYEDRMSPPGENALDHHRPMPAFSESGSEDRCRSHFVPFGSERLLGNHPGSTITFAGLGDDSLVGAVANTGASTPDSSTETDKWGYEDTGHIVIGDETAQMILEIGEYDVLLGRGRTYIDHPGNKMLQGLVDTNRGTYDSASRTDKTNMTKRMVKVVRGKGGRFLKREKGQRNWVEVSDETARRKVSHAMRDSRKKPHGSTDKPAVGGLGASINTISLALAFEPSSVLNEHSLPDHADD